jgi:hypothetical protein
MLKEAQLKAAELPGYKEWVTWMREHHPYARAVRMALFLGFKIPNKDFYLRMQQLGKYLKICGEVQKLAQQHDIKVLRAYPAGRVRVDSPIDDRTAQLLSHTDRILVLHRTLYDYTDLELRVIADKVRRGEHEGCSHEMVSKIVLPPAQ